MIYIPLVLLPAVGLAMVLFICWRRRDRKKAGSPSAAIQGGGGPGEEQK